MHGNSQQSKCRPGHSRPQPGTVPLEHKGRSRPRFQARGGFPGVVCSPAGHRGWGQQEDEETAGGGSPAHPSLRAALPWPGPPGGYVQVSTAGERFLCAFSALWATSELLGSVTPKGPMDSAAHTSPAGTCEEAGSYRIQEEHVFCWSVPGGSKCARSGRGAWASGTLGS